MSTHNIVFYEEIKKFVFQLSSKTIKYAPSKCSLVKVHLYFLFSVREQQGEQQQQHKRWDGNRGDHCVQGDHRRSCGHEGTPDT